MNPTLLTSIFHDPFVAQAFSDKQTIAYMVEFEVALANVQAKLGIIPTAAAQHISEAAQTFDVNLDAIRTGMDKSSVPTILFVQQFRAAIGAEYGSYVHWGATSQDVMDTALVLQLRACIAYLEDTLQQVLNRFAGVAQTHRSTLMAGRTHSQQALPITFGFKVAGWIAPLLRHQQRLAEIKQRLLVLQFSGAVGTLAALGAHGEAIQNALANELNLGLPLMAWHTQRDTLAEFAAWLSTLTGSMAKMAQDIILMAQSEIAEILESDDPSRGGSSTMPQKRNPVVSEIIIAAARHNAALLASMHSAMIHEHERATGSWQLEWLSLPQMLHLTATALQKARFLSENLVVNTEQMYQNVAASNGLILAEAIDLALAPIIGRTEAKRLIRASVSTVLAEGRHLVDVVREQVDASIDWESLRDEKAYLGQALSTIDRMIAAVDAQNTRP